jgi:hypothetical protein
MAMFRMPVMQRGARSRPALAAVVAVAALTVNPAFAAPPSLQFGDFYYPDDTPVVSDGGMPFAHAALLRYSDQRKSRIMWQIMTQGLTPGRYDIWIEGSNDGEDTFRWWVGSAKATPQGDLDAIGLVYTGVRPGEFEGKFTNPDAPLYLVITDADGDEVQATFFPDPDPLAE